MARKITVELVGYVPPKVRARFMRRWGSRLQPESVTAGWYAAGCPSDYRPSLSFGEDCRWRLARILRGCR